MNIYKAVLAAVLGAVIGGMVALQAEYVWWMGALVGGLISYVTYDAKEFVFKLKNAISSTWKKMRRKKEPRKVYPKWVKKVVLWESLLEGIIAASFVSCSGIILLIFLFFFVEPSGKLVSAIDVAGSFIVIALFTQMFFVVFSFYIATRKGDSGTLNRIESEGEDIARSCIRYYKDMILKFNFICAPFTLSYLFLTRAVPWSAKFCLSVVVKTYKFTISDGHIIALLGGSMGSVAGYFMESIPVVVVTAVVVTSGLAFLHKKQKKVKVNS